MREFIISKKQNIENNFRRNYFFFESARAGLTEILKHKNYDGKLILLP